MVSEIDSHKPGSLLNIDVAVVALVSLPCLLPDNPDSVAVVIQYLVQLTELTLFVTLQCLYLHYQRLDDVVNCPAAGLFL